MVFRRNEAGTRFISRELPKTFRSVHCLHPVT